MASHLTRSEKTCVFVYTKAWPSAHEAHPAAHTTRSHPDVLWEKLTGLTLRTSPSTPLAVPKPQLRAQTWRRLAICPRYSQHHRQGQSGNGDFLSFVHSFFLLVCRRAFLTALTLFFFSFFFPDVLIRTKFGWTIRQCDIIAIPQDAFLRILLVSEFLHQQSALLFQLTSSSLNVKNNHANLCERN